jgi:general secretion pathway protein G
MLRRSRSADDGWTLIELFVVLSIVVLLATLAMSQYRNSIRYAKEAALRSDLFLMRDAIDQYYADKGRYPESLQTLVSESYLRAVPRDPFTESSETWITVPADPEPGSGSASAGIYDIKSGSADIAMDGSRYGEWIP